MMDTHIQCVQYASCCPHGLDRPIKALTRLYRMAEESIHNILDYALEEVLALTQSEVGYIYFYSESTKLFTLYSWSKSAMESCAMVEKQTTYELENTGLWGEVVRGRCPIIVNDYQASHPLKKGYPQGHVHLKNFLSVPVCQGKSIVAVVGVGNKKCDYAQTDIDLLELYAQGVWSLVSRRQAEESLLVDRELNRLKYLMNEAPIPVCFMDKLGAIAWCNDSCLEFLGVQSENTTGKTLYDFCDLEHAERVERYGKDLLDGRARQPLVAEITARGGQRRTVVINKSVYRDAHGEVLGLIGTLTDISESKRLETALAKALEFNNTILEHAPVGIAVFNAQTGQCVLANRQLADMLGGTVASLTEQNFRELASWKTSGILDLAEQALASRAIMKTDMEMVTSFGKQVFLECTFAGIEAGGEPYLLCVAKDILPRKQMEAELSDQLAFVKTLVDAIPSPVFFKDSNGRYVWCNKAFKMMWDSKDPIGKTMFEILPHEEALFHVEMEKEIFARNAMMAYEYKTTSRDGHQYNALFTKAPFSDSKGSVKGLICVMTDITARKRAEEDLRQSEEVLQKILLGIKAGIIIVDPQTFTVVDINAVAEEILGAPRSQVVGKPCTSIRWSAIDGDEEAYTCPLLKGNLINEEFRIVRADGTVVPVIKTVVSA